MADHHVDPEAVRRAQELADAGVKRGFSPLIWVVVAAVVVVAIVALKG